MKPQHLGLMHCYIAFVLLLLAGCTTSPVLPGRPPSSSSISPTYTPASIPESVIPTLSLQTSIPSTPTVVPTLAADKVQALVVDMLKNNRGCELPCWWDVIPGETTWESARNFFIKQGVGWNESGFQGGRTFNVSYPDHPYPFTYRVNITMVAKDNLVQSIAIRSEGGLISNHFAQDWNRYSLGKVLEHYGPPSNVLIGINLPNEQDANSFYYLYVFYQQIGVGIAYSGVADYNDPKVRMCPIFEQVSNIDLWLQSPKSSISIEELAITPDEKSFIRSLAEATGMGVETFQETFKGADEQKCLEMSANLWP